MKTRRTLRVVQQTLCSMGTSKSRDCRLTKVRPMSWNHGGRSAKGSDTPVATCELCVWYSSRMSNILSLYQGGQGKDMISRRP